MKTYHMHKWSVVGVGDPYLAPECQVSRLAGFRDDEERPVVTSRIVKVEGRTITTENSIYILDDIDPEYLAFATDNGYEIDEDWPITPAYKALN